MTRDEMIRLLVLDRLEHRDDLGRYMRLQKVLENGFRGFRNMSDTELSVEIDLLGLVARDDGRSDDLDDLPGEMAIDPGCYGGGALLSRLAE